jgi:hypothetical protein
MNFLNESYPVLDAATAKNAWSKYDRQTGEWLALHRHLDDVASVAEILWDRWLPNACKGLIARSLGEDEVLAKKLSVLLAAGHDIGKHSGPFAGKVPQLKQRMIDAGANFINFTPAEVKSAPHGVFSGFSFIDWMTGRFPTASKPAVESIAVILAGHHGVFPTQDRGQSEYLREKNTHWHEDRFQYWGRAAVVAKLSEEDLELLATSILPQPAQMVLCGFLIVCDWVGSNKQFFPLNDSRSSAERAKSAVRELDLPAPWTPVMPETNQQLFRDSFKLPAEASPRPVQTKAMELARTCQEPSLFIIEAPTGEGKTEAALTAAEILASRFQLGGVTVALPTCATSDAMFPRITRWLENRLPDDAVVSTVLTHGKAQFNEEYRGLFGSVSSQFSNIYDDEATGQQMIAHWWLAGKKTSALADFTVGTIDQVLFAALRSRHLALRHLGLSGKVVILDEIHTADSYMNVYLDRVLEWLGAMMVPVIALSATLDPQRRAELLISYKAGMVRATTGKAYKRANKKQDSKDVLSTRGYPLISVVGAGEIRQHELPLSGRENTFYVDFIGEGVDAIVNEVLREENATGCIGVVCNTINRAQEVYESLVQSLGSSDDVILLHSRFLGFERRRIEKSLVEQLGPQSNARPSRLIVVSTQVIEQSMDIDFDLLVSDICPMDLLFQRAGRLHRHARATEERPNSMQRACFLISGCTQPNIDEPPTIVKGIKMVYGESKLLRSLATILQHGDVFKSPGDVEPLVRRAYSPDLLPPVSWDVAWKIAEEAAEKEKADKEDKAKCYRIDRPVEDVLWDTKQTPVPQPRDEIKGQAQVRDIDEGLEVILMQQNQDQYRTLALSPTYPHEVINFDLELDDELSRELAKSAVSLPAWVVNSIGDDLFDYLEQEVFTADQVYSLSRNRWLRDQLFLPLDDDLCAVIGDFCFQYDRDLGLRVVKQEQNA